MIEVFENVLSKDFRDSLIQMHDDGGINNKINRMYMRGQLIFDQFTLPFDTAEAKQIAEITRQVSNVYFEKYDPLGMTPMKQNIEPPRVKRYEPNEGCFPLHIDARRTKNATRYLAFLYYLNDNDAGTRFRLYNDDITVPAVGGNVLVFPPMWMFPHEGLTPTTKPKYIMSVYYHFMEEQYVYGYERESS